MSKYCVEDAIEIIEDIPSDYDEDTDIESDFDTEDPDVDMEHTVVDPLTRAQNLDVASTSDVDNSVSSTTSTTVGVLSSNNAPTNVCRKWRKKLQAIEDSSFSDYNWQKPPFDNPLDAFLDFFNDTLVDKIHYESNLYCTPKDKTGNITKKEIYVSLGINIIMGYNKLPSV